MKHILLFLGLLLFSNLNAQPPKLHIETKGKGVKQVLLLPGFSCSGKVWDSTVSVLSKEYTCHVVTFPGFAGEPAQAAPSLHNWVAGLAQYLEQKNLKNVAVLGHSIGGIMALQLAAAEPKRISQVVVVDALPCLAALQNPAFKASPSVDHSLLAKQFAGISDSAWRSRQEATSPMFTSNPEKQKLLVNWSVASDRSTMGTVYSQFANTDYRDSLSQITCPVLVLLEPSFKGYEVAIQAQYSKLPRKTLAFANIGMHFIMWDDPQWYFGQLNAFLL
jgi:pimeloyl-ACP methyl ester carboxylesterase